MAKVLFPAIILSILITASAIPAEVQNPTVKSYFGVKLGTTKTFNVEEIYKGIKKYDVKMISDYYRYKLQCIAPISGNHVAFFITDDEQENETINSMGMYDSNIIKYINTDLYPCRKIKNQDLIKGKFGDLQIGMNLEAVLELLGSPTEEVGQVLHYEWKWKDRAQIPMAGDMYLHFRDRKFYLITMSQSLDCEEDCH